MRVLDRWIIIAIILFAIGLAVNTGLAAPHSQQPDENPVEATIRVGIKNAAPLVILNGDNNQPTGFSIDLWEAVAADLRIKFEWVPTTTVDSLLADVQSGKTDVAISGISITPPREEVVDFSYPYLQAGLQIMIPASAEYSNVSLLKTIASSNLFKILAAALVALIIMAHLIWFFEMRSNPEMPKSYFRGVWDSMWWALKMLIKQEYLDAGMPATVIKRLFVMAYMILGIFLIAEFTAAITTSQTVSQLRPTITGLADLQGKRVLTVAGSTSDHFLLTQNVRHNTVERIEEAYTALLDDETDAIVFDSPVLLFYAQNQGYGLVKVVGPIFQEEDYGIALPIGSPLRKPINLALLRMHTSGRLNAIYTKWFGPEQ